MGLYNEASLIMYPSGYKSGKIYCQKPTDGSGDLTFTRASTATRVNESGLIEEVASGVPRIDFTGGGCGKLLLEPQRTNKALWNRDMTNAVWLTLAAGTGTDPVVTSNYAVSPSGDTDADRIVFNAGAGTTVADASLLRQNTILTSGLNYGYSVWLKSNTGSTQKIKLRINSDLPFPEVTVTNEWVRYSVIYTSPTSGNRDFGLDLRGNFAASADLLVWGFQLEENVSYITSLIPTAGSTVTRLAEQASISGLSTNAPLGTSYTLYAYYDYFDVESGGSNRGWRTAANVNIYLIYNYGGGLDVFNNSAFIVDRASLVSASNFKIAIVSTPTTVKVFINGVNKTKAGSTPNTNTIDIWAKNPTTSKGENIRELTHINRALSDAEAIALTTI